MNISIKRYLLGLILLNNPSLSDWGKDKDLYINKAIELAEVR